MDETRITEKQAYDKLVECGLRPSMQRIEIMKYLLSHPFHPTVDEVFTGLEPEMPTLSKTTVYNTLRLFSEKNAAQMITIDEHRVCYDGDTKTHVHFYCTRCGKITDMYDESVPHLKTREINGCLINNVQVYYKGVCKECREKEQKK